MGAKKKSKANKLAKMSEEERIRYLQHRAAVEEEAKRRKEQLISTYLKNKLKKEEIFSRLNMAKINQQWRQTLRQIKCIELRQDLEDLLKWFNYTINKKTRIIEILLTDLDEAESQYSYIHWCQLETIDQLIGIHSQRIGHFYEKYRQDRNDLYNKAMGELSDGNKSYLNDEENLQATLYRMEETFNEKIAVMASKHQSKIDEIRNEMLTELENLKNSRETQIEKIWKNFETILKKYWEQTEERQKQYSAMRDADYENRRQIFENNQQINSVIDTYIALKDKLSKIETFNSQSVAEYKTERENSRNLFFSMKKRVTDEIESDKKKLNFMSSAAEKLTYKLKGMLAKGEQILQLHGLCRKLEKLEEKMSPERWDKSHLTEEEEQDLQNELMNYTEPLAMKAHSEITELNAFWKRFNLVLLEKEALYLHNKSLLHEQKQLKGLLKNYFSDFVPKQPESKVSHPNGIRFCHSRPSTCVPVTKRRPLSVTCLDAIQSPSIQKFIKAQAQ